MHSHKAEDQALGERMCNEQLMAGQGEQREMLYFLAVAQWRQGHLTAARKTLKDLLEVRTRRRGPDQVGTAGGLPMCRKPKRQAGKEKDNVCVDVRPVLLCPGCINLA